MIQSNVKWLRQELRVIEAGLNDSNYFVNDRQKRYWIDRANDIKFDIGLRLKGVHPEQSEG